MKKGNCQPEINILKKFVNPISKKVISDSTILIDKNVDKSFPSYFIETIHLNSSEDIDKETGFITENDINELIRFYNCKMKIGPKLNLEINNIEIGLDSSDIFELQLNLISDPSESLLYKKRNRKKIKGKEHNQNVVEDYTSSSDSSYSIESRRNDDLKKQLPSEKTPKINNKVVEFEIPNLKQEILTNQNKIKQTNKTCNCVCTIF